MVSRYGLRFSARRMRRGVAGVMAAVALFAGVGVTAAGGASADASVAGGDYVSFASGTRVLDTRNAIGVDTETPMEAKTPTTVQVTGIGSVPSSGVSAVMATVAVLSPSSAMLLKVWPSGGSESVDSVIHSVPANKNLSTTSALRVGSDGAVVVQVSSGTANVILDIQGYFTTSTTDGSGVGGFIPVTQTRMVDSRSNLGTSGGSIAGGGSRTITVDSSLVPTSATALYVNVLVPSATATGTLFLAPGAATTSGGNAFNYLTGHTSSGLTVKLSGGKFTVRNSSAADAADVVIDVFGYWSGSADQGAGFRPANDGRVLDTRVTGTPLGANGAEDSSVDFQVGGALGLPVENVAGVLLNVHVAATTNTGKTLALKAWGTGEAEPGTSVVNGAPSATRSNTSIVTPGADGKITVKNFAASPVNVYVELEGWFSDPLPDLGVDSDTRTTAFQAVGADSSAPGPIELSFVNNAGQLVFAHVADPDLLNAGDTQYTTLSQGETFTGSPVMVQQPDRLLSIVGQRTDTTVWNAVQSNASTGAWGNGWTRLGGSLVGGTTGGRLSDGRAVTFGVNSAGALWVQAQDAAGDDFGAWTKLADTSLAQAPTVVTDSSGAMLLFARTSADTIVVAPYSTAGVLGSWTSLGQPSSTALDDKATPSVLVLSDRLRVFVTAADGTVMTLAQNAGGSWPTSWGEVAGLSASGPVAADVEPTDGTAQVFARSSDGYLAWVSEATKASGTWTSWKTFANQIATDPSPLVWEDSSASRFGMIARLSSGDTQIVDFTEATKPAVAAASTSAARSAQVAAEPEFFDLGQPE